MKFKKFLGAVCSFLLATTSLFCGGPASAKNWLGGNFCVFMVNSGEDLGNGKRDGDECDKACWSTITGAPESSLDDKKFGYNFKFSGRDVYEYLMLNQYCPTVVEAIKIITGSNVPDVFVVVVNLSKNCDDVIADLKKHFDQISKAQKEGVLYGDYYAFESGETLCGQEVYLRTVPVVIYGVVPEGMTQTTSNEELVGIAEQIRLERQGDGAEDGKFKYIHNKVYVRQSDGKHISINMDNDSETIGVDFRQDLKAIANDESLQPTLWENYRDKELPRRAPELAKRPTE